MNRRDAILKVAGLMGASFSAPLLMGLSNYEKLDFEALEEKDYAISQNQQEIISAIAELIIPETSTPGAKSAKVPEFIIMMIEECYKKEDKEHFYSGLNDFEHSVKNLFGKSFTQLSIEEQTNHFLKEEKAVKAIAEANPGKEMSFIPMIKELTLFGYFTSEPGCTQALNYLPVPGAYKSCIDLKADQKTWAL